MVLTKIPVWISNNMPDNILDETDYLFTNFNGANCNRVDTYDRSLKNRLINRFNPLREMIIEKRENANNLGKIVFYLLQMTHSVAKYIFSTMKTWFSDGLIKH